MKVHHTWNSACAGKGVYVGIYRSDSLIGVVSYAHLAHVPAFTRGQVITTQTVLGYLKWWNACNDGRTYDATTASSTHTHVEVGAVSGKACYMPLKADSRTPDTRIIGKILPGSTATCP